MSVYSAGPSPYLHEGRGVAGEHWKKICALLPLLGLSLQRSGWFTLVILTASLAGWLAGEALAANLFKKKLKLLDGTSVFNSLLFFLLLPKGLPPGLAAAGAFFASFAGREIFGGLGCQPFLPALVGRVLLEISFPQLFTRHPMILGDDWIFSGVVLAGAALLFFQKRIFLKDSLIYLGLVFSGFFIYHRAPGPEIFSPVILFSAFFLLPDPAVLPTASLGRGIVAGTAGISVIFLERAGIASPFVYALLAAGALSPWMDRLLPSQRN